MAQLLSSGVTPEYLKAMADAYAQYFPQQQTYNPQTQQTTTGTFTPEAQMALQQLYSPTGYSPVNAAPTAVVPSQQSVVGGLFQDLYPQTSNTGRSAERPREFSTLTDKEWAAVMENRNQNGWNNPYDMAGLKGFGSAALGMLTGNPLTSLLSAARYGLTQKDELASLMNKFSPEAKAAVDAKVAALTGFENANKYGYDIRDTGNYNVGAEGGGINGMGNYSGQDNVGNRGDN